MPDLSGIKYVGTDWFGRAVFKTAAGKYYKSVETANISLIDGEVINKFEIVTSLHDTDGFDGEPGFPLDLGIDVVGLRMLADAVFKINHMEKGGAVAIFANLEFVGVDDWGQAVFRTASGTYYKTCVPLPCVPAEMTLEEQVDLLYNLHTTDSFDGDAGFPVLKNVERADVEALAKSVFAEKE